MNLGYNSNQFNTIVKKHLSEVKSSDILEYDDIDKSKAKEIFKRTIKGKEKTYGYIFPNEVCTIRIDGKNFSKYAYLPQYREDIIKYLKSNSISSDKKHFLTLHRGQTHLNSSQGLVLNFLIPIILSEYEENFTEYVFGHRGKITIEHSMNDDGGTNKPTEVDFSIQEGDIFHLYEAKYTENNFGKVTISKDNREYDINKYRAKWTGEPFCLESRIILNEKDKVVQYNRVETLFCDIICDDIDEKNTTPNKFTYFKNYQLVRNLYNTFFRLENGQILKRKNVGTMNVLISNRNKTQKNEFNCFYNNIVEEFKMNVNINFWEDVCAKAIEFSANKKLEKLLEHYKLFEKVFLGFGGNHVK